MSKVLLFLAGGIVGAGAVYFVLQGMEDPKRDSRAPTTAVAPVSPERVRETELFQRVSSQRDEFEKEIASLTDQLEETRKMCAVLKEKNEELAAPKPPPEPEPEPSGPPTEEEARAALIAFATSLQTSILSDDKSGFEAWREFAQRGGKPLIDELIAEMNDPETAFQSRVIRAHALAQSGFPEAIEALKKPLQDPNASLLEVRYASHALAFTDAEGVDPVLEGVARHSQDIGARANAAFGLARKGKEEGYVLYMDATDAAFAKKDPAAIQYLSGFMLLGEKAYPYVRERLKTYEDPQAKLFLMEILKGKNDVGAIPALRELVADPATTPDIKKAAQDTISVLEKSQ